MPTMLKIKQITVSRDVLKMLAEIVEFSDADNYEEAVTVALERAAKEWNEMRSLQDEVIVLPGFQQFGNK